MTKVLQFLEMDRVTNYDLKSSDPPHLIEVKLK